MVFPSSSLEPEPSRRELRRRRKFSAHFRTGRPSNARKFDGEVYRLHNPQGNTKKEAQKIAEDLRMRQYKVRIVSPLAAGDRFNVFRRKYWVFKRKRVV